MKTLLCLAMLWLAATPDGRAMGYPQEVFAPRPVSRTSQAALRGHLAVGRAAMSRTRTGPGQSVGESLLTRAWRLITGLFD